MSLEFFLKDGKAITRLRQGLFGPYLDAYAGQLRDRGYNYAVAGLHLRLIGDFGRWTKLNRVPEAQFSFEHAQRYARYRRRKRKATGCDASAIKEFIEFLRQCKVVPVSGVVEQRAASGSVLEDFVRYLRDERALAPATIKYYREFAQEFLLDQFGSAGGVDFEVLGAADVLRFIQGRACRDLTKRAKLMVTALRAFCRYLQYKGIIDTDLASAVPSVAQWSKASLPKSIPSDQVELVLSSRKGNEAIERRDYATFLLLARLGLRAGEVVSLMLDDIDWQEGFIAIRGKGGISTRMPLLAEVGEAIASYLLEARPSSKLRFVFLSARAPVTRMTVSGLSTRVRDALDALGIQATNRGTHLFRHSLATNMLREGASLREIGELLRHRSTQTTEVYAKVDLVSLRPLALPWPGGEQ
jgi:integrase/recombinase XerD